MEKHLLTIFFLWAALFAQAQIDLHDYDTVRTGKPIEKKLNYEFDNPFFREISIRRDKAIAEGNYPIVDGPNNLMGIVGKGPVPNYLLPSLLISDPPGYGWEVDVYTKGTTANNLVKTSEGKSSEIPASLKYYWQSGWLGLIRNGADTFALFGVSGNPRVDSLFRKEYLSTRSLHPPVDPKRKEEDRNMGLVYRDYGVFGEFKEAKLMIMFYERNRTAYIFLNDKLDAIFQIDYDNPGALVVRLSKNSRPRVMPVLLVRKGVTEDQRADLCRLAAFSMLMAQLTR